MTQVVAATPPAEGGASQPESSPRRRKHVIFFRLALGLIAVCAAVGLAANIILSTKNESTLYVQHESSNYGVFPCANTLSLIVVILVTSFMKVELIGTTVPLQALIQVLIIHVAFAVCSYTQTAKYEIPLLANLGMALLVTPIAFWMLRDTLQSSATVWMFRPKALLSPLGIVRLLQLALAIAALCTFFRSPMWTIAWRWTDVDWEFTPSISDDRVTTSTVQFSGVASIFPMVVTLLPISVSISSPAQVEDSLFLPECISKIMAGTYAIVAAVIIKHNDFEIAPIILLSLTATALLIQGLVVIPCGRLFLRKALKTLRLTNEGAFVARNYDVLINAALTVLSIIIIVLNFLNPWCMDPENVVIVAVTTSILCRSFINFIVSTVNKVARIPSSLEMLLFSLSHGLTLVACAVYEFTYQPSVTEVAAGVLALLLSLALFAHLGAFYRAEKKCTCSREAVLAENDPRNRTSVADSTDTSSFRTSPGPLQMPTAPQVFLTDQGFQHQCEAMGTVQMQNMPYLPQLQPQPQQQQQQLQHPWLQEQHHWAQDQHQQWIQQQQQEWQRYQQYHQQQQQLQQQLQPQVGLQQFPIQQNQLQGVQQQPYPAPPSIHSTSP